MNPKQMKLFRYQQLCVSVWLCFIIDLNVLEGWSYERCSKKNKTNKQKKISKSLDILSKSKRSTLEKSFFLLSFLNDFSLIQMYCLTTMCAC